MERPKWLRGKETALPVKLDSSQVTGRGSDRLFLGKILLTLGVSVVGATAGTFLGLFWSVSALTGIPIENVMNTPDSVLQPHIKEISLSMISGTFGGTLAGFIISPRIISRFNIH